MSNITQADLDALTALIQSVSTNQGVIFDAQKTYIDTKDSQNLSQVQGELSTAIGTEVSDRNTAITSAINTLKGTLPDVFPTLQVFAAALDNDPSFAATIRSELSSANTTLTNAVNVEKARIDSILTNADPAALDSLSEIVTAFQAADGNLNTAITTLAADRTSALAAAVTTLEAADSALTATVAANKAAIEGTVSALTTTVANNKSAIEGTVATLTTTVSNNKSAIESSLASEVSRATAAEQANATAISDEATARSNAITAESNARVAAVDAEVATRQSQDASLLGKINELANAMDGFKATALTKFAI